MNYTSSINELRETGPITPENLQLFGVYQYFLTQHQTLCSCQNIRLLIKFNECSPHPQC